MQRVMQLRLTDELDARVRDLASQTGMTDSAVARTLMELGARAIAHRDPSTLSELRDLEHEEAMRFLRGLGSQ